MAAMWKTPKYSKKKQKKKQDDVKITPSGVNISRGGCEGKKY